MLGEEATTWLCEIITALVAFVAFFLFVLWATRTAGEPPRDTADLSLERVDVVALAAQADQAVVLSSAPPRPVQLPYFPYAAASETAECVICLEPLLPGQLCSEVPACRHVFHRDCLDAWAKSKGTCPLCRAKIVPGSDEVAVADDMV
ncbi:hypothetical protein EJB05_50057, partial [Eragrostis curvula]